MEIKHTTASRARLQAAQARRNSNRPGSAQESPSTKRLTVPRPSSIKSSPVPPATSSEGKTSVKTYRVCQIPDYYGLITLKEAIRVALGLTTLSDLQIRSLSAGYLKKDGKNMLLATLECKDILTYLNPNHSNIEDTKLQPTSRADEWQLELSHPSLGHVDKVFIDSHFTGFTPLSPQQETYNVDCVAIHGLGSHAFGAFRASDQNFMWLRDRLPFDIPNLRVWTYGYEFGLQNVESFAGTDEHAETFRHLLRSMRRGTQKSQQTPLILIAHSLGGIILKQAFIEMKSSSDSSDHATIDCTTGILFFGVPSQGMNTQALAAMIGDRPQRYDLSRLDQDVGYLLRDKQHRDFCKAFDHRDAKILQFFETKMTRDVQEDPITKKWTRTGPLNIMVNIMSATSCGREWENTNDFKISLNCDHRDMVKFGPNDHEGYPKVKLKLEDLAQDANQIIAARDNASRDEQNAFLESLTFPEMGNRANEITKPLATTFQWIWKDENHKFSQWLTNKMPIFLVQGKPGSGKSTLIKHILERRQQEAAQNHELVIGFFFNERGISQYYKGLSKEKKSAEETRAERIVWDTATMRRMFSELTRVISQDADKTIFKRLLFIVDGLDECDTSFSHFKEVLNELIQDPMCWTRAIKICCSSRPNNRITFLKDHFGLILQGRNSEDIKTYVEKTANGALEQGRGFGVLTDEIIAKADGIILWAELVLKELLAGKEDGNNISELQEALRSIPPGLKELFERMLGRIDVKYILESKILLRTVLFAQRPLTLEELRQTMAFGFESFLSQSDYMASPKVAHDDVDYKQRLQSRGGGLLEVVAKRSTNESSTTVRFIHQAVKDFIQTESDFLNPASPDTALSVGHHFLLQSCMRYLSLSDFADSSDDISNLTNSNDDHTQLDASALREAYPFLEYATLYWVHHWRLVSESRNQSSLFAHETSAFIKNGLKNWINTHQVFAGEVPRHTQDTTLLSIAAENGIANFLRSALQDHVDVNRPSGRYGYLLQAAAANGHEIVVELLLKRGAEINAQGGYYGNALIAAAFSGHDIVVRCLLNHRAAFSLNPTNGETALQAAIDASHKEVIKELLRCGAYVAESDANKSLILSTAANVGDWPLVELLLLHGADVNQNLPRTKGKESEEPEGSWTLLHIAVDQRSEPAITKMLLEKGADTSAQDDMGQTALRYALYRSHTESTKLLMTNAQHAEESTHDDDWNTLHCLAVRGDVAVVQLALSLAPDLGKKTKKGWTALHIAAEAKNREMLIKILNQGCLVNDTNGEGWTALHLAVDVGFTKGVMELMNKGADVDETTPNQWTALHLATYHGLDKITELLLTAKPDLSKVTADGYTALHLAAQSLEQTIDASYKASRYSSTGVYSTSAYNDSSSRMHNRQNSRYYPSPRSSRTLFPRQLYSFQHGYYQSSADHFEYYSSRSNRYTKMIRVLIEAGANINDQTLENWTVLHFAAKVGNLETIEYALANKVNVNATTKDLWTPLHLAVHYKRTRIAKKLLAADADISIRTDRGVTALHLAVNAEDESMLDLLLSQITKEASSSIVNQVASGGYTALHLAAELRQVGMVYSLLRKGADAKLQDNDWKTALEMVPEGNDEVTFLLLPQTTNILGNLIVEPGQSTVLHMAASKGHLRVIELLINDKVDVNIVDNDKLTPLHEAVKFHQLRAVRLLLKNSASVKAKDAKGRQPLHLAAASNQESVGMLLLNADALIDGTDLSETTPLHEASKYGHKSFVRLLLERSADVNAIDSYSYTALHWAAENGHEKVIRTLLKHKAKLEAKDNAGQTSLHIAVKWRRSVIVQLLLAEAADVSMKTNDGSTALHLAAVQGDKVVIELLLDTGAELNAKTNRGLTALQLAQENKHDEIMKILRAKEDELTPKAANRIDDAMEESFAITDVAEESSEMGDIRDQNIMTIDTIEDSFVMTDVVDDSL